MDERERAIAQVTGAFERLFPDRDPEQPLTLSPGDQLELLHLVVTLIEKARKAGQDG